MHAVLAVAPTAALDNGLTVAIIFAAGVTALAALGMMLIGLHRTARLTVLRGITTSLLGIGVVAIATLGIVAASPGSAQAASDGTAPPAVTTEEGPDIQLPTLSLD